MDTTALPHGSGPYFAGGFIYDREADAVLLHLRDGNTKHNPNKWAFFGGLAENEETARDCFRREVREEIGVELDERDVIELDHYMNPEFKTYRYVFFAERPQREVKVRLTEGAGFGWVPVARLNDYELTSWTRKDMDTFLRKGLRRP